MRQGISILAALYLSSFFASLAGARPARYVMTELGTSANRAIAWGGINSAGQAVGDFTTASGTYRTFISNGTELHDMGVAPGWVTSSGRGMNDLGQAVGLVGDGVSTYHAAFFPGPGLPVQDLGALGGVRSGATDINSAGLIVGYAENSAGTDRPILWANGQTIELGLPSGTTYGRAEGINESGQIVGSGGGFGYSVSFIYSDGQMTRLNNPGDPSIDAKAINNKGQVTGTGYFPTGGPQAFLYSDGELIDLGSLGTGTSIGSALNDLGEVVGSASVPGDGSSGFIYTEGAMHDLNSLIDNLGDKRFRQPLGINNSGQIVGFAYSDHSDPNTFRVAVLTPIPEPAAIFGMLPLLLRLRTRR